MALGQVASQTPTIVGFVADQSCRKAVDETRSEDVFDELAFVRGSAFGTKGERKTGIIGESDDSGPLAPLGAAREALFAL